jgi:hypothetical protein
VAQRFREARAYVCAQARTHTQVTRVIQEGVEVETVEATRNREEGVFELLGDRSSTPVTPFRHSRPESSPAMSRSPAPGGVSKLSSDGPETDIPGTFARARVLSIFCPLAAGQTRSPKSTFRPANVPRQAPRSARCFGSNRSQVRILSPRPILSIRYAPHCSPGSEESCT